MGTCIVVSRRRNQEMQTETTTHCNQSGISLKESYTISQVARLTGVNAKAIRYYESIGLLPRPPRGTNRYRRYSMADINRLNLLCCIRFLGISLATAKPLLIGATEARCIEVQRALLSLVSGR